jgi:carbon storage regulator
MLRIRRHGGPRRGDIVLVLTRRANQSIMIGHEIVVTVLEVRGDQVRLGIKAPRSIDVHREEIFAQLQQANRDAAQAPRQPLESLDGFAKASDAESGSDAQSGSEASTPRTAG